jgi:hypothetical protein
MTGLNAGNKGDIVGYNPWNDFRLNPDEMKALWGIK